MDEDEVTKALIDYLQEQNYTFYVDPGSSSNYDDVRRITKNRSCCDINTSVKIAGKTPDFVGVNAQDEIIVIEEKGDDDLRQGIGQATDYRRGVHKSYLAAEQEALERYHDTARAASLGTIPVADGRVIAAEKADPNHNMARTDIDATRQALVLKSTELDSEHVNIPSMARPENALYPVVVLKHTDYDGGLSKGDCESKIENSNAGTV